MSTDEFLKAQRDIEDARRVRQPHPKGWEPGVDTARGTLTVQGGDKPPTDWTEIIRELGLNPAEWTVDETQPVQVRAWDTGSRRLYYYKATVIPAFEAERHVDVLDLIKEVKRRGPSPHVPGASERALVVCLADWQAGKADHGGVTALLERLFALKEAVPRRVQELKRAGRPVDSIYVIGMGDMVEGCDGHYAQQTFSVQLDARQQEKLVRRMLVDMLKRWSKLGPMVVGCVPGNHGEKRKNGKSFTTFEDNTDLAVFEQAAEILGENPDAYGHVSFVIPDGDMTITLDIAGTLVAFAHGHQARSGGGGPQNKLRNWWQSKMSSFHPVGDASVLVSAHYHHLQVVIDGPRTWMQCPANDGGSRWFEEQGGPTTACGTLTFVAGDGGWSDLAIL